jgi:hypothetical protein
MQTSFFAEAKQSRQVSPAVTACVLVAAALALIGVPHSIELVVGLREVPDLALLHDLPPLSGYDTASFFGERDQIEIRVAADTMLRTFLDRNRLNKPYQRAQIVEQLGSAAPETRIAAGTVFTLRLTPMAADVPGATTMSKERPR